MRNCPSPVTICAGSGIIATEASGWAQTMGTFIKANEKRKRKKAERGE
jgi:hypothetical protein